VPAGGLSPDEKHWISCRNPRYFLPVQALAAKCQGKFLALLRRAFRKGKLRLAGTLAPLQHRKAFHRFTFLLKNKKWVAYVKKPFAGPQHVIQYLAHYTHRVAISNGRLLSFENGQVTFRWRDSAHGNKQKVMTLDAVEFMRRFLLHVLPRGFVKIRRFGYLANRQRKSALQLCSTLISSAPASILRARTQVPPKPPRTRPCPYCQKGMLVAAGRLSSIELRVRNMAPLMDTS